MGVFTSNRIFFAAPALIPEIAEELVVQFQTKGYQIKKHDLLGGDADISITKGGVFKAVAGMKTALKITLRGEDGHIKATAGVGIFGEQAIPTVISMLFFWPVLMTQMWGIIQQSKLDDCALEIIEKSICRLEKNRGGAPTESGRFCPECGSKAGGGKFCSNCGTKLTVQ